MVGGVGQKPGDELERLGTRGRLDDRESGLDHLGADAVAGDDRDGCLPGGHDVTPWSSSPQVTQ